MAHATVRSWGLESLPQIRKAAAALLLRANVEERLPTPVDDLVAAAGLLETEDFLLSEAKLKEAPRELGRLLRTARRKILGALDRRERVLHVSPDVQIPAQRQFIRCHETMHDILRWQRDLLVLADTCKTLVPDTRLRFEQEANQGAAELLFQLDLLTRIARDYPTDVTTPVQLAGMFGASIHATFRRWVENHPGTACVVVLDPNPVGTAPVTFRRFEVAASDGWLARFGRGHFPPRLDVKTYPFLVPLGLLVPASLDCTWTLVDRDGCKTSLRVQTFTNSYRTFLLTWLPQKEGFIARHRPRARIVVRE